MPHFRVIHAPKKRNEQTAIRPSEHFPKEERIEQKAPGPPPPGKTNLGPPPARGEGGRGDRGRENSKGRVDRQPTGSPPKKIFTTPLTSGRKCDIISKPCGRERANASRTAGSKLFEKSFENLLTSGCECDIIDKLSTREPRQNR